MVRLLCSPALANLKDLKIIQNVSAEQVVTILTVRKDSLQKLHLESETHLEELAWCQLKNCSKLKELFLRLNFRHFNALAGCVSLEKITIYRPWYSPDRKLKQKLFPASSTLPVLRELTIFDEMCEKSSPDSIVSLVKAAPALKSLKFHAFREP